MTAMPIPQTTDEAAARLREATIPGPIVSVVRRLQDHGHQAVLVGGAVRDALLGLAAEDWDVASSATPQEVQAAFKKTIPTGIEHGTVTVMVRGSGKPEPVEVTTFRGEGAYVDGRRPTSVVFLRDLIEDLARRDFTVNAFAWDPVHEVFTDPFGGLADLAARRVRAVGDPEARFAEDGLRVMRAVRFCATRELSLDPATQAAIPDALPVLDQVSRERVHVELFKLLKASRPSLGLRPLIACGMWPHILAEVPRAVLEQALPSVDGLPADPVLRLAHLLLPLARQGQRDDAVSSFERLKPSKADRQRLVALLSDAGQQLVEAARPVEYRTHAARLGREYVTDVLAIHGVSPERGEVIATSLRGAPLSVRELAVAGRDLIEAGVVSKGPAVGRLLAHLLDVCLLDPSRNQPETLLRLAASWDGR